jgi:NAD-dependent deacetylase
MEGSQVAEHAVDKKLIRSLQQLIDRTDSIVFFGGAGVSTESGLPDFRGGSGLFRQQYPYPPEIMLSRSFFYGHTSEFYDFYREKMIYLDAKPNAAHLKLAELEKSGKLKAVVTQNIDGLHQAAGSKKVLELHGSVHRNYCLVCGRSFDAAFIRDSAGIARCPCGGLIKPDVVLYEETLNQAVLTEAARLIRRTDLLIIGGTSLAVYPAAGLAEQYLGNKLVLINRDAGPLDDQANLVIHGPIAQVFGEMHVKTGR